MKVGLDLKMSDSYQEEDGTRQSFPEQIYFQNCIVIGHLPKDTNMNQFFSFFHDIVYWKTDVKQIIPDLQNPDMKAVILTYENEELARLCAFRAEKALSRTKVTFYDGNTLFLYCNQLDRECDPRSRNVAISGLDTTVPKDMYLDLFKVFGTVRYFEFCCEGDIPKARFEFTRVTSAFAAVLSLHCTVSKDSLVHLEIPLFSVAPISPGCRRHQTVVSREIIPHVHSTMHLATDEIREQYFWLCSMNTLNYYAPEGCCMDWGFRYAEDSENVKETVEECSMGTVSLEFSRKRMRERGFGKRLCGSMFDNLDKRKEESRRLFLQAARRKILSYCL